MFSAPVGYQGPLRHSPQSLHKTGAMMTGLLEAYPQTVLFSAYNIVAHTHEQGLP